jgi:hypothetical protein
MKFFGRASSNYKRIKTFKKSQPLLPETFFHNFPPQSWPGWRPTPNVNGEVAKFRKAPGGKFVRPIRDAVAKRRDVTTTENRSNALYPRLGTVSKTVAFLSYLLLFRSPVETRTALIKAR